MKLDNGVKQFSIMGNWIAKAVFSLVAIALMWQCPFLSDLSAMAVPSAVVATSVPNQVKGTADQVRDRSKELIQDTKKNVERTANRNAVKVDQADDQGSFVERKAQRDRARIEQRAEEDASKTERAVDDSMNAVKGAVEKIKDAFGS
jgi:TolA-binding protein